LYALYSYSDYIKKAETGEARNACKIYKEKPNIYSIWDIRNVDERIILN